MHFIEANTLEIKAKWDSLVQSHAASIFTQSAYLDATSSSWMILYNQDESAGIACPYVIKAGIKVLVTPFYFRYVEWVGEPIDQQTLITSLKNKFPVCSLQIKGDFDTEKKYFQIVAPNQLQLNKLAKRTLKKAGKFEVNSELKIGELVALIEKELAPKIAGIDSKTLPTLRKLIERFQDSLLIQLNLYYDSQWCGGIWLFETEKTIYYMKGATTPEAKKDGGMYRLIFEGIELAHTKEKIFDFGGSNVSSVRKFNLNFAAQDEFYSNLDWNNAPFWWKGLRYLKGCFKN